jgi:hypothetical protein
VLNAIPATAGSVGTTYLADNSVTTAKIAPGAVIQADLATNVAGTGPAFSAYQSVQQTGVSATTWTKVTLTTELFDTNNNYASSRFTPTVAGYYQINGTVTIVTTNTTHFLISGIYKNGTLYTQASGVLGNSNFYPTSIVSTLVYLNGSTDYVELYCYGSAGGAYNIYNTLENTNFNGVLVRAA